MIVNLKPMKSFFGIILLSLALLPIGLKADVYINETGQLSEITRTHIFAGDLRYKLLPTVKVVLKSGKRGKLEQLSKGDNISMKILTLDKKSYVDTITQLPEQSEEN